MLAAECTWQPGFHGEGLQDWVWDTVVWNDGSGAALYVAGAFRSADGIVVNRVAKWNGSQWSSLGTGMNAPVRSLEVWNDGTGAALYAGGEFTTAGGVSANHIAKWNGTSWSPVGTGMNGQVLALTVHNDGSGSSLFAGGVFTIAGGVSANRIAKWNGSAWSSLGTGATNGVNHNIWGLGSFDLGNGSALYLAGEFTLAGGNVASRIAKWEGNTFSSLGAGFDNMAIDLTPFNDGSGQALYAVGHFTASGSTSVSRIAKWNGTTWSAVGGGLNGVAYGVFVHNDGNGPALYVGGGFGQAGSVSVSNVAKWDGSNWSSLSAGVNSWVRRFATFDDGGGQALFVLGGFTRTGSQQARYVARWRNQTWSDLTGGSGKGMDAPTWALASFGDSLYAGGEFTEAGGVPAKWIARWNGSSWSEPGGGMNNLVQTLTTFNDGSGLALYAGGGFTVAGGVQASRVARFNGSTWSPVGLGLNHHVYKLRVLDDGTGPALYAAGHFSFSGSGGGVAKWNGTNWTFLGAGFNNAVRSIEVFNDGSGPRLYAGGHFTQADGQPANYIAKWNGSTWQALPTEPNAVVYELKTEDVGSGQRLLAGGDFTLMGSQNLSSIAQWDGSVWSSVDGGFGVNGFVYTMDRFDVGNGSGLYVGGAFDLVNGLPITNIVKRSGGQWLEVDSGTNASVLALASHDAGMGPALYAGGYFSWAGSNPGFYLAKYSCNTPPPAADLRVTKSDGVNSAQPGATLTYTITASNVGGATDPGALLADAPPSVLTCSYSSTTSGGASTNRPSGNGAISATLQLPPGGSVTYTMTCLLSTTATGSVTNTATLTASIVDSDPSNNTASDTDQISANLPNLRIPDNLMTAEGATIDVPVEFSPNSHNIAGVGLSIDYDEVCLDPDINNDGVLDHVVFLNSGFSNSVAFNPADTDGEIDITVADVSPPFAALPEDDLVVIRFTAICAAGSVPRAARVGFSTAPPPSFSNTAGVSIAGTSTDGRVWILSGLRGDCNGDGVVNVADLVSIAYEIFDGDGTFWLHAPNPTYPGSPAGCDANASTYIQVADLTCANLLIFGGSCSSPLTAFNPVVPPVLEVSTELESQIVWLRASLIRNGNDIGSIAFSLDLDPQKYDLSRVDADGDGRPDHVRFPNGEPDMAHLGWDLVDGDGELDVLLADLGQLPLGEGLLVEIGIPAESLPRNSVRYSANPAPSFGQVTGGELPGIPLLGSFGSVLFSDGFESGLSSWDVVVP